jgi:hypothetical protein
MKFPWVVSRKSKKDEKTIAATKRKRPILGGQDQPFSGERR